MTKVNKRADVIRVLIGVILMIMGFIVWASGKPSPGDPTIMMPTYSSMLIGCVLIIVGFFIGRKSFDTVLDKNTKKKESNK